MIGIMESQKSGHLITGNFDLISQQFGNGSVSSITFSSIPQTYKSLQLRVNVLNASGSSATGLQFNGVTTGYYVHGFYGIGTSVMPVASGATTFIPGIALTTTYPSFSIIDIIDYASTAKYKTTKLILGLNQNTTGNSEIDILSGLYTSTTAITSLTYYSTGSNVFSSTSSFALYGVS